MSAIFLIQRNYRNNFAFDSLSFVNILSNKVVTCRKRLLLSRLRLYICIH